MNETIPDKEAYQTNRLGMCWAALGMMIACTAATIYDPMRMSEERIQALQEPLPAFHMRGGAFQKVSFQKNLQALIKVTMGNQNRPRRK